MGYNLLNSAVVQAVEQDLPSLAITELVAKLLDCYKASKMHLEVA